MIDKRLFVGSLPTLWAVGFALVSGAMPWSCRDRNFPPANASIFNN